MNVKKFRHYSHDGETYAFDIVRERAYKVYETDGRPVYLMIHNHGQIPTTIYDQMIGLNRKSGILEQTLN